MDTVSGDQNVVIEAVWKDRCIHESLKVRLIQKKLFTIFLRERLTKADSDFLDNARGVKCKTTAYNLVPQILIKNQTCV